MARLSIDDALGALAAVEAMAAAFVETAPDAAARMGGAEGIVARCEMTEIGPVPRLSVDEWSAMALEHATIHEAAIACRLPPEPKPIHG